METKIISEEPHLVVVLAGGRGRRMGGNKPLRPFSGATLIEKVIDRLESQDAEICINAGRPGTELALSLSRLGHKVVHDTDAFADLGPMSGVCAALQLAAKMDKSEVITVPCDMPGLPADFVRRLSDAGTKDCDVVHFKGERDYPLCAMWHIRLLPDLLVNLEKSRTSGGLGVLKYLDGVVVRRLPVTDERAFLNINTSEDLTAIQSDIRDKVAG